MSRFQQAAAAGTAAVGAAAILLLDQYSMPPARLGPLTASCAEGTQQPEPKFTSGVDGKKLKLVQVVFRHGARTPLTSFNETCGLSTQWDVCGNAYKAVQLELLRRDGSAAAPNPGDMKQVNFKLPGGCSRGELTMFGQVQALQLGHWLRQRYVADLAFLPHVYKAGVVASRTTNYSRTVATLRGVLTGLYPDAATPVRVVTSGDMDEIMFADSKTCPHLKALFKQSAQRNDTLRSQPGYINILKKLQQIFPNAPASFWEDNWVMVDVHDVLTSLATHGKQWPQGVTPSLYREVEDLSVRFYRYWSAPSLDDELGHPMIRLSMGRLLDILVANMEETAAASAQQADAKAASMEETAVTSAQQADAKAAGEAGAAGEPLLRLYSGHDSTIFPLLVALGLDVQHWPPYLSNITLELWEDPPHAAGPQCETAPAARHYVRVLYNQQEVQLPCCSSGDGLELAVFKSHVVGPFLLSAQAHEEACSVSLEHNTSMPQAA